MTVQLLYASGLYGAATLAAALDAGLLPEAERRVLLVANNASVPETVRPLDRMPGFEHLRGRFDSVRSWNEAIAPLHPAGWMPRSHEVPLWERYLRLLWGLGDERVELVVESIQVAPALALARLFPDAPLDVYADGLMSYGPTRVRLDPLVGERVRRVFHPELVPGLRPLLLAEFGAEPVVVPEGAFTKVLDELAGPEEPLDVPARGGALLLGQYLAALDVLSPDEEEALHLRMVRGTVALGHDRLVFKPHPVAPASWSRTLEREAEALGAELTVLEEPVLAEVVFRRMRPDLVVGCFSTALFTAARFHGIPVARTGTGMLLERLTPYENSNRVPVTLADVLLPDLDAGGAGAPRPADAEVTELVAAVGYAMQPRVRPDLRPAAERHLSAADPARVARYFRRRRLTALGLPGGLPASGSRAARRLAGKVLRRSRRLRALRRRLAS
ncbi:MULTISPECIES: polysialyltransferase family glycosyltransferase [Streptomyces]|uniref:Alpha-2,8-polysialyltransferase family protein n=1 Tax=Streptomyces sudanensis TaxID=436397 RepID=A0ABY4T8K3_9ACTN|nr:MULTISPECIES: polysialyltransferase family glycosyltransferase [Streptomyces]URN15303.1 alpha-2,8-polysialyltransferase family protein [Streptomyces sudanensis]